MPIVIRRRPLQAEPVSERPSMPSYWDDSCPGCGVPCHACFDFDGNRKRPREDRRTQHTAALQVRER